MAVWCFENVEQGVARVSPDGAEEISHKGYQRVCSIIKLRKRLDDILHKGFRSDSNSEAIISVTLSEMIEENVNSSEYFSDYFDQLLRNTLNESASMHDDDRFADGLRLVPLLPDKFAFQHCYLSRLSVRLGSQNVAMELEDQLLSSLGNYLEAGFIIEAQDLLRRHRENVLWEGGSQPELTELASMIETVQISSLPTIESVM
jgi:hypothetical protein